MSEMNDMNNFELHDKALELVDTMTPYQLARMVVDLSNDQDKLKEAFLAGMECYEYALRTGVPYEDCFDQWVEYKDGDQL